MSDKTKMIDPDPKEVARIAALLPDDHVALARWWCRLNVFEWPEDFPVPEPVGSGDMTDQDKRANRDWMAAWREVNDRADLVKALEYWNKVFLPARNELRRCGFTLAARGNL